MAQHDALRIAGAARRVLDERGGLRILNLRQWRGRSGRLQARDALQSLQDIGLRAEQSCETPPFRQRDQEPSACVAQNAGLAAQMLFDLREPHRRINRDGNRAGIKDAEKGDEEIDSRRQHQGDAISGDDIAHDQAAAHDLRPGGEFAVGERAQDSRFVL